MAGFLDLIENGYRISDNTKPKDKTPTKLRSNVIGYSVLIMTETQIEYFAYGKYDEINRKMDLYSSIVTPLSPACHPDDRD